MFLFGACAAPVVWSKYSNALRNHNLL
jgi:hypothetical protein